MRSVTRTYEVYTLAELKEVNKAGYDKAIEKLSEMVATGDPDWHDGTLDYWKDQLRSRGYGDVVINYSGFSSQGDGASFTTDTIDVRKLIPNLPNPEQYAVLRKELERGEYDPCFTIRRIDTIYSHENTVNLIDEPQGGRYDRSEKLQLLHAKLYQAVKDDARDQMRQIYRELEAEYDGMQSEEAVADFAEANNYGFLLSGKMFKE